MYTLWNNESIPTTIAWDMAERVPRLVRAIGPPLNWKKSLTDNDWKGYAPRNARPPRPCPDIGG